MWQKISGFSDYLINEKGSIFRVSTKTFMTSKPTVTIKDDSGEWKTRAVSRLVADTYYLTDKIVATPIKPGESVIYFTSIKEAAQWLINTKQAITNGRLAAYQTIRTNIKHGISQPDLYPYVYGYSWKKEGGI